jgi:peptidoglycan-associated lipoprotein
MRPARALVVGFTVLLTLSACHKAAAPAPAPTPTPVVTDNGAADRARAEAARRDSIARADSDRRAALARAEAERNAKLAADRATITSAVYFEYDRDALTVDATQALEAKVPVLLARSAVHIRIEGNADDRGSDEYNLALGQRRSAAVKRFLMARGIADGRIETVSFGEEHAVCKDDVESCWSRNRRDEFVIVAGGEMLQSAPR